MRHRGRRVHPGRPPALRERGENRPPVTEARRLEEAGKVRERPEAGSVPGRAAIVTD